MKIQYISDVHLEISRDRDEFLKFKPEAPVLILAGDIGNPWQSQYQNFLEYCSKSFEHVIVISGNHEYYQKYYPERTMEVVEQKIRELAKPLKNVYFLQNESITIGNYIFYGTTLWTSVPSANYKFVNRMNDYSCIYHSPRKLITIDQTNSLHHEHAYKLYKFLNSFNPSEAVELPENEDTETLKNTKRVVVITHHCPLIIDETLYKKGIDPLRYGYHVDMSSMMKRFKDKIGAWIYGHTHHKCHLEYEGIQIASNPKGYPNEYSLDKSESYSVEVIDLS